MTHRQLNKLSMLMALSAYLGEHTDIVEAIPGLAKIVAELEILLESISAESQQQLMKRTGVGDRKRQLKADLVADCADVARKLAACAVTNDDLVLLSKCQTSDYKLSRMKDEELVPLSRVMLEQGTQQLPFAAAFGLDQNGLSKLEAGIAAFTLSMPGPRMAVIAKKVATEKLVELFDKADQLIKKADLLVAVVMLRQPSFYSGYKSVRTLIDRAGRGWQLKVTVTDAANGEPIAGAVCEIIPEDETNSVEPLVRKSAARGSFGVKSLPEVNYRLNVSKLGYLTKSQAVMLTKNELEKVIVALERV